MKTDYTKFVKDLNILCKKHNMCIFTATSDEGSEIMYITINATSNFKVEKEKSSGIYYIKEKK
jgi:hypothetical protein